MQHRYISAAHSHLRLKLSDQISHLSLLCNCRNSLTSEALPAFYSVPAAWSTMRHQAFYFHHKTFGGSVGVPSSRCYALQGNTSACKTSTAVEGPNPTCLMRQAMCLETRCSSKGEVEAIFRFDTGDTVPILCPQGMSTDACLLDVALTSSTLQPE